LFVVSLFASQAIAGAGQLPGRDVHFRVVTAAPLAQARETVVLTLADGDGNATAT
jgi:hypothetical protein